MAKTFIVGVQAFGGGEHKYSLLATFNQANIVLLAGVPQRHFVSQGETEFFVFNNDRSDADIIITTTAISGDPDVLVSTINSRPSCELTDPSSGSGGTARTCSNYTWMSADWRR